MIGFAAFAGLMGGRFSSLPAQGFRETQAAGGEIIMSREVRDRVRHLADSAPLPWKTRNQREEEDKK